MKKKKKPYFICHVCSLFRLFAFSSLALPDVPISWRLLLVREAGSHHRRGLLVHEDRRKVSLVLLVRHIFFDLELRTSSLLSAYLLRFAKTEATNKVPMMGKGKETLEILDRMKNLVSLSSPSKNLLSKVGNDPEASSSTSFKLKNPNNGLGGLANAWSNNQHIKVPLINLDRVEDEDSDVVKLEMDKVSKKCQAPVINFPIELAIVDRIPVLLEDGEINPNKEIFDVEEALNANTTHQKDLVGEYINSPKHDRCKIGKSVSVNDGEAVETIVTSVPNLEHGECAMASHWACKEIVKNKNKLIDKEVDLNNKDGGEGVSDILKDVRDLENVNQVVITPLTKTNKLNGKEALFEDGKFQLRSKSNQLKKKLNKETNLFGPIKGSLRGRKMGVLGGSI
ncbi:hypothetical protein MA16_Dca023974 [Dendrobium catenatum]|uniref:Uncharacterized protein n=1 Tax=Dendrobium catenatum TaxID=906689 RepID=A0A2I0VGC7_9ASPA|nr:hypothetical protein MA16_Dca023974 [Dendrobium catenatum]